MQITWRNLSKPSWKGKAKHIPCIVTLCSHAKSHFFEWSISPPEMILRKYLKYLLKISYETPEEKIGCKSASNKQLRIVFIWTAHKLALQPQEKGRCGQCFFQMHCEQPTSCMAGSVQKQQWQLKSPGAPS